MTGTGQAVAERPVDHAHAAVIEQAALDEGVTLDDPAVDVTVVVPTIAGREALLARAIASVDRQTRPPAHVEIVLDLARHGAWWARNEGAARARTRWIAWLDDDDELLPEHLELLVAAGEEHDAGMVYGYPTFVGPDGEPARDPLAVCDDAGHLIASPVGVPFGDRQARWIKEVGNYIPVTYLIRRELVLDVGGMPEPFSPDWPRPNEDHGFLVRLIDHRPPVRIVNAGVVTWRYHFHGANTGGRGLVVGR